MSKKSVILLALVHASNKGKGKSYHTIEPVNNLFHNLLANAVSASQKKGQK